MAFFLKRLNRSVNASKSANHLDGDELQMLMELFCQRCRIGWHTRWTCGIMFCRAKTSITIPAHAGADGATASTGDGSKAGEAFGDQHTDMALPFTF